MERYNNKQTHHSIIHTGLRRLSRMTVKITSLLLCLTLSIASYDASKILAFFPFPSISHQVVFRPITEELARRGHEVTVITTDPAFPKGETPANLTEIDVHDFSYEVWKELYKYTSKSTSNELVLQKAFHVLAKLVEMQMNLDQVQKMIQEEKFDLIFIEACVRPALLMSHVVKAPVILLSTLGPLNFNTETIGSVSHPLLYPDMFNQRLYNLSKWEKLKELWRFYKIQSVLEEVEDTENEMARRMFGPNAPTISELKNNVDMLFLNIYPTWEGNRPVPPSVVYMGGIHQKPKKELPTVTIFIICLIFLPK